MEKVTLVSSYNPLWPEWFQILKVRVERELADLLHRIEHVGSTAIPDMTAKPIIDLDIVIDRRDFQEVKQCLSRLGYIHEGDKGIPGREAFDLVNEDAKRSLPKHHLYVCMEDAPEFYKHLAFRDFMRGHPEWVRKLSDHKIYLCELYKNDRQAYIDGKSEMVQQITGLARAELQGEEMRPRTGEIK